MRPSAGSALLSKWKARVHVPPGRDSTQRVTAAFIVLALLIVVAWALVSATAAPTARVILSSGQAWVASPAQGFVTLIDGPSDEIASNVAVAAPGAIGLTVTQDGMSALVTDSRAGTVTRIDGATGEPSRPVQFATAGSSLSVMAAGSTAFIIDATLLQATVVGIEDLKARTTIPMASRPGPGQFIVDSAERLWTIDANGSGLNWYESNGAHGNRTASPTARLLSVQGRPALVDIGSAQPTVGWITGEGEVEPWNCRLATGADDVIWLLGDENEQRLYAADSTTGTLVTVDGDNRSCGFSVAVGSPGSVFGDLVQSGRFIFVPNRTAGVTYVVDADAPASRPAVLDLTEPGNDLELVSRDGFVFYNDRDSERAGVLKFVDNRWVPGPSLSKYAPDHPEADVTAADTSPVLPSEGISSSVSPPPPPTATSKALPPETRSGTVTRPPEPGAGPSGRSDPTVRGGVTTDPAVPAGSADVSLSVTGSGVVSSSPAGLSCRSNCRFPFDQGGSIRLTASPDQGWSDPSWSGTGVSCAPGTTCTVRAPAAVTVTFTQSGASPTIMVGVVGAGHVLGEGLNCPGDCDAGVSAGGSLALTAVPDDSGAPPPVWSGITCAVGTSSCPAPSGSRVTVTFPERDGRLPLTVSVEHGGVKSSDGGLDCLNTTCSADFDPAIPVKLIAAPDEGFEIPIWGMDGASCEPGALTCEVPPGRTVRVSFSPMPRVTVIVRGPGRVTSSPTGLDCQLHCVAAFPTSQPVILTASPEAGSDIPIWSAPGSACDSVRDLTCEVATGATVTVTFPGKTRNIAVKVPEGAHVTSVPAGIDCAADCEFDFDITKRVTLTTTVDTGWVFAGWSERGDCGSRSNCDIAEGESDVVMTVLVSRDLRPVTVTIRQGGGRVTGGGIDCPRVCTVNVPVGTTVDLTADANGTGWGNPAWSAPCATGWTCSVAAGGAVDVSFQDTTPPVIALIGDGSSAVGSATTAAGITVADPESEILVASVTVKFRYISGCGDPEYSDSKSGSRKGAGTVSLTSAPPGRCLPDQSEPGAPKALENDLVIATVESYSAMSAGGTTAK